MSFYDDASLVFLPSGEAGKDGKAYSMKPTNGDGDFTFSRGSNLTATRVDSNGLIEKGRENLLLQSNQFDTTWSATNSSVTSGQSGYDGSSDAWLLTASSTSNARVQQNKSFSGVHTFSVYAKSGTNDFLYLRSNGALTYEAYFNLSNGTKSNSSNLITEKITSVGDGWYRCSITFNASSSADVRAYIVDGFGTINVTNNSTIYIQDAQLEQGLVATEYIESGATTGKAGLLEDSPRFDYSGGASCPSLLLEPSRTNLVGQSEYFNSTDHILNPNISVVNNNTESPEGVQNAAEITFDSNTNRGLSSITFGDYSSQTHSVSIYAKSSGGVQNVRLKLTAGGVADYYSSNFLLTDEWQRFTFSKAFGATATSNIQGGIVNGTGESVGTCYIYGLQLEANASYPTSYIPNHSGGSVTRNADVCEGAGTSSTFNDDEGVLYVEASALANDGTSRMIALSDATSSNHIRIYPTTTDNRITIAIKSNNVNQYVYHYDGLSDITDTWKVAVRYKRDDFATFVNGTKVDSSSSGSVATGLDELQFNGGASANPFYGKSNQVIVFNSYLSDANCITLTS